MRTWRSPMSATSQGAFVDISYIIRKSIAVCNVFFYNRTRTAYRRGVSEPKSAAANSAPQAQEAKKEEIFKMDGMITEKTVKNRIGRRNREIHKGDCGRVLIAAGSWGMAGAAILAARAALRAGAGLVRLAIPEALFPIVQVGVPEATCIERNLSNLDLAAYDAICAGPGLGEGEESIALITKLLEEYEKTLLIDADGLNLIAHQNLFPLLLQRQERFPSRTILTPHMGEAKRLLGDAWTEAACARMQQPARSSSGAVASGKAAETDCRETSKLDARLVRTQAQPQFYDSQARMRVAEALVEKTGAIVVLKGAGTIVAARGRKAYTNTTGNPGMATGGSGDTLSGIITGLAGQRLQVAAYAPDDARASDLAKGDVSKASAKYDVNAAQPARAEANSTRTGGSAGSHADDAEAAPPNPDARMSAWDAAICGVYIHGLAGDLAAQELGEYGVTAGDLAQYTAYAIKRICGV